MPFASFFFFFSFFIDAFGFCSTYIRTQLINGLSFSGVEEELSSAMWRRWQRRKWIEGELREEEGIRDFEY